MNTDDSRVTARIVRIEDGETYHEYKIGGVPYPSTEAVEAALDAH